jgi:hypothetical protein
MAKTKAAARKANLRALAPFLCNAQFEVMSSSSEFDALIEAAATTIAAMPVSYEQDGKGEEATAFLHYFSAGSDWYISEKDADGGVDQAFGLAILNGDTDNAELGYISIRELVANGVELDLHFTPATLGSLKAAKAAAVEQAEEVVAAAASVDVEPAETTETTETEPAAETAADDDEDDGATTEEVVGTDDTDAAAEELPDPQTLVLPIAKLRAAALCMATKDVRHYLEGVYLHATDGVARVVATDGSSLLAQSHKAEILPDWLEAGVILDGATMKEALAVCAKHGDEVSITFGEGRHAATLRSQDRFATFEVSLQDGKFPDYQRVISAIDFTNSGDALGAGNFAHGYIKTAATVAATLGAKGLQAFTAASDKPSAFLFDGADEAVLIVMPLRPSNETAVGIMTNRTAQLVGTSSLSASVGALRAHLTRCAQALKKERDQGLRAKIEQRQTDLQARIDALLAMSAAALPAPQANA